MEIALNYALVLLGAYAFCMSSHRILNYKSYSLADFVVLIIVIFNCLPIALDIIYGYPTFSTKPWFSKITLAYGSPTVSIVYDTYIGASLIVLLIYLKKFKKKDTAVYVYSNSSFFTGNKLLLIAVLPVLYILLSGEIGAFVTYGSALQRGLSGSFSRVLQVLEIISLFVFCCWFFEKKNKHKNYIFVVLYSFVLLWIDGKRYIIVTIGLMVGYFYLNSVSKKIKPINIKILLVVCIMGFVAFNGVYVSIVKPMVNSAAADQTYTQYRIDYGRDGVTKFVLYRELIENKPILEYRGETFLSTLLTFVPRRVWSTKPYPHYMYMTAALFSTKLQDIPSGITPSLFEMDVANLGVWYAIPFTCALLVVLCSIADNCKSLPRKAIYLILATVLLTQSIDAALAFVIILPFNILGSRFKINLK